MDLNFHNFWLFVSTLFVQINGSVDLPRIRKCLSDYQDSILSRRFYGIYRVHIVCLVERALVHAFLITKASWESAPERLPSAGMLCSPTYWSVIAKFIHSHLPVDLSIVLSIPHCERMRVRWCNGKFLWQLRWFNFSITVPSDINYNCMVTSSINWSTYLSYIFFWSCFWKLE